eukprot:235195-Amphidinium_carterae.1
MHSSAGDPTRLPSGLWYRLYNSLFESLVSVVSTRQGLRKSRRAHGLNFLQHIGVTPGAVMYMVLDPRSAGKV